GQAFDAQQEEVLGKVQKSTRNTVVLPDEATVNSWKEAVTPVIDDWRKLDPKHESLYESFTANVKKVRSGGEVCKAWGCSHDTHATTQGRLVCRGSVRTRSLRLIDTCSRHHRRHPHAVFVRHAYSGSDRSDHGSCRSLTGCVH